MHTTNINKTYFAVILFVASLFVLLVPIVRVAQESPAIPGSEHYAQLNNPTIIVDFLLQIIPGAILALLLPLALGILSLVLYVNILQKITRVKTVIYYALIILVLTPTFLAAHIGITDYQFILPLLLLVAYWYLTDSKWIYFSLALLYLFDPLLALALCVGMIIHKAVRDKGRDALITTFFVVGILIVSSILPLQGISFGSISFQIDGLFTFFGAKYGYSLFMILLGLGGLLLERKRNIPLLILLASVFYEPLRIAGGALLAYYSAKSFFALQERKWNLSYVGMLTLVLFISILVFGTSTYVKENIQERPLPGHVDGLFFLRENGVQAQVLASPENTEFVTYITGNPTVSKANYFSSQNYDYIDMQFRTNDIAYIFIDQRMLDGEIWEHDEEGLLFLMTYNDNFKKIYEREGVTLYYFAPWSE